MSMGRKISSLLVLLLVGILISACSLFGTQVDPGSSPGKPGEPAEPLVLFEDDFSQDEIGALPSKWNIEDPNNLIEVEVVAAPELSSGKALKVSGGPSPIDNKHARLLGSFFGSEADGVNTIVIEQDIQFNLPGSKMGIVNMYITKSSHRVHWNVSGERNMQVIHRRDEPGTTTSVGLGQLQEGWNKIRIIASREQDEVIIYVNDLDNPVTPNPLPFREIIDTWQGAQVIFLHHFFENSQLEILYGNIRVWALD